MIKRIASSVPKARWGACGRACSTRPRLVRQRWEALALALSLAACGADADERGLAEQSHDADSAEPTDEQPRASLDAGSAGDAQRDARSSTIDATLSNTRGDATTASDGQLSEAQRDASAQDTARFDLALFETPPRHNAPGLRWVWPGGAVEDDELAKQVALFAQAGYGSVEVQPMTLALSAAQVAGDPRIRTVGEPVFFERVRALASAVRAHGLEYDLTLGSGWPNGGLGVPVEASEQQIFWSRSDVSGPATIDIAIPPPLPPSWVEEANNLLPDTRITADFDSKVVLEAVLAAPLRDGRSEPPVLGTPLDVTASVVDGRLQWSAPEGRHAIVALYRNHTARIVLKAAFAGDQNDARVVDHLDRSGARWLIEQQVASWVAALGAARPKSFFIDSFELTGELPWSPGLAQRYQARVGHAPFADMLFFFRAGSETMYIEKLRASSEPAFRAVDAELAQRAREDYEAVRAQAFREEFVEPMAEGLHEHGVGLRMQAHGGWGVSLDDYAVADIPESEGLYAGGSFDFLTLAASAAHVAGRPEVSSEAFTTLNLLTGSGLFDENALWRLSGLAFTAGINHLIHSWCAYPYTAADGQAWNSHDTNPSTPGSYTLRIEPGAAEWAFLPAFNRAQARIAYALTRGTPRVDLAWLKSTRDHRDFVQLAIGGLGTIATESAQSSALRGASYTYDRVSPSALATAKVEDGSLRIGAARYRALLIDDASVIEPSALEAVDLAVQAGLPVVWVGAAPTRAPGNANAAQRDARVAGLWGRLQSTTTQVQGANDVPAALRARNVQPEVEVEGLLASVGIAQRETEGGRVVWLFNESDLPQNFTANLRMPAASGHVLDPATGKDTPLTFEGTPPSRTATLALPALRGVILWLPR